MSELTHFDNSGAAHMVNVGDKPATHRQAVAEGAIEMAPATFNLIAQGRSSKGDIIGVARIAAIQATKRTGELIPLCHPLALTHVAADVVLDADNSVVRLVVTAETTGPTGVEMEALTAVSVGLLTIYDMCKAVDRGMRIVNIRLLSKRGGTSGEWRAHDLP